MPVITGGIGICHLYIDEHADLAPRVPVIRNAKVQRPTVCNALDTVLVHRAVAVRVRAGPGARWRRRRAASASTPDRAIHGAARRCRTRSGPARARPAARGRFRHRVAVARARHPHRRRSRGAAIAHIDAHIPAATPTASSPKTPNAPADFLERVDSAAVYWNASTRFTDGGQLGLGAEVAVSTQRIHARGPMGLEELTSYKWVVEGDYHSRK
jgi:glutamate-5-semialdehyde dehydrogenase